MLLVAGTETTGNTLTAIAFHLLKNPSVLACLREELKVAMPTTDSILTWSSLEKLPFLVRSMAKTHSNMLLLT
jgi:cytochrome P450